MGSIGFWWGFLLQICACIHGFCWGLLLLFFNRSQNQIMQQIRQRNDALQFSVGVRNRKPMDLKFKFEKIFLDFRTKKSDLRFHNRFHNRPQTVGLFAAMNTFEPFAAMLQSVLDADLQITVSFFGCQILK